MLSVSNLTYKRHNSTVLSDINFTLSRGTLLFIRGSNGAGKSTLLRCIAGLLEIDTGDICCYGVKSKYLCPRWQGYFVYMGHRNGHKNHLTCLENLQFYVSLYGYSKIDVNLYTVLEEVGLKDYAHVLVGRCSEGQKKRLALARLYMTRQQPVVWLLDEPTSSLDKHMTESLCNIVTGFCKQGGIVLMAEHQTIDVQDVNIQEVTVPNMVGIAF